MSDLLDMMGGALLARARVAAWPDHRPWEGDNHARCPICHAQAQIRDEGLSYVRPTQIITDTSRTVRVCIDLSTIEDRNLLPRAM